MKAISLPLASLVLLAVVAQMSKSSAIIVEGPPSPSVFVCTSNDTTPCVSVPSGQCFLMTTATFSYSVDSSHGNMDHGLVNLTRDVILSDGTGPGSLKLPFSLAPGMSQALFLGRNVRFHANVSLRAKPGRGSVTAILEGTVSSCSGGGGEPPIN